MICIKDNSAAGKWGRVKPVYLEIDSFKLHDPGFHERFSSSDNIVWFCCWYLRLFERILFFFSKTNCWISEKHIWRDLMRCLIVAVFFNWAKDNRFEGKSVQYCTGLLCKLYLTHVWPIAIIIPEWQMSVAAAGSSNTTSVVQIHKLFMFSSKLGEIRSNIIMVYCDFKRKFHVFWDLHWCMFLCW